MFVRGASFVLSLVLATAMAGDAFADHRARRRVIIEEQVYAPEFFERIPGVRTLFGDYALTEDEYNELYGPGTRDFDESYYEPEPNAPVKPKRKPKPQQGTKLPTAKPAAKSASVPPVAKSKDNSETASIAPKSTIAPKSDGLKSDAGPASEKTASAGSKGVSCEKATGIVTGFGFTSVTPQNCAGKVYAFNATRGGKNFSVKVDPASGELTEVKKLP